MKRLILAAWLVLAFALPAWAQNNVTGATTGGTETLTNKTLGTGTAIACAGQVALSSATPSTATVSNACFSGATDVVLCTFCDGTGQPAKPLRCVPSASSLAITGPDSVTSLVCYARVK